MMLIIISRITSVYMRMSLWSALLSTPLLLLLLLAGLVQLPPGVESCTSLYCINGCGASQHTRGFKLVLANNRDENIYRQTIPAGVWPPRNVPLVAAQQPRPIGSRRSALHSVNCDRGQLAAPYDLCAYGALDTKNGEPPAYYSTWLGINERGSVGNLLFYMKSSTKQRSLAGNTNQSVPKSARGPIVGSYIQNSSWSSVHSFLQDLSARKRNFDPFNYVQLEMSNATGAYSLFYLNNVDDRDYVQMNDAASSSLSPFFFGISNNNVDRPFRKVEAGKVLLRSALDAYSRTADKSELVRAILHDILQNETAYLPDANLADALDLADQSPLPGISQINANYSTYWRDAYTRTSTLILVDFDNNVEYYEYNLTSWRKLDSTGGTDAAHHIDEKQWKMNKFSFRLKQSAARTTGAATTDADQVPALAVDSGAADGSANHDIAAMLLLSLFVTIFLNYANSLI